MFVNNIPTPSLSYYSGAVLERLKYQQALTPPSFIGAFYLLRRFIMNQNHPPIIGIVSGIGPLAGSDILAKLFKNAATYYGAIEDHEYPDVILLNHGIKGVDNTATLSDDFEKNIVNMSTTLENYGANIIGIACNTAHLYLDKINFQQDTKLVNLIDIVAIEASKKQHRYLLLTSTTSKDNKLYHRYLKKHGVNFAETDCKQQRLLDHTIELVMAHKLESAGKVIQKVLDYAKNNGFTAVIAACTELPIAIDSCDSLFGLEVINSNDVLSKELLKIYYDQLLAG
jgi:aspartate racemase